jgi:hypothetical protein
LVSVEKRAKKNLDPWSAAAADGGGIGGPISTSVARIEENSGSYDEFPAECAAIRWQRACSAKAAESLCPWIDIKAEFVVAAAEVLQERVPGGDHSC